MNIRPSFIVHLQPAKTVEPAQRAFGHPAIATHALTRVDPVAGQAGRDAAASQGGPQGLAVIGLVGNLTGRLRGRPRGRLTGRTASTVASNIWLSRTLAAEMVTLSGSPFRSTIRWRFVPDLPRFVGSGPALSPPGRRHAGGVHGGAAPIDLVGLAQPIEQHLVQLLPDPRGLPFLQPAPAGHARAAAHRLR
jgi:hypothetical protein